MILKILEIRDFKKSVKRLSKKYKKFVDDYQYLIDILESGNHNAAHLGDEFYKIRLKNSSIPQGKSGGFRVVYFFKTKNNEIYLLDIYSKNEIVTTKKEKLVELAKFYGLFE